MGDVLFLTVHGVLVGVSIVTLVDIPIGVSGSWMDVSHVIVDSSNSSLRARAGTDTAVPTADPDSEATSVIIKRGK